METGDILGHEFMGEVVEVGRGGEEPRGRRPRGRAVPDRLRQLLLLPARAVLALRELQPERVDGREAAGATRRPGIFGYSHMLGGYRRRPGRVRAGAVRRRRAAQGPRRRCPTSRCCSSPTSSRPATWRAEMCDIQPGDTIAVWGCGPVGQFAIASAYLLGAERVIAIDRFPYRLRMARENGRRRDDQLRGGRRPTTRCKEMTGGRGPGRLHRRGRHGGARPRHRRTRTTAPSRR